MTNLLFQIKFRLWAAFHGALVVLLGVALILISIVRPQTGAWCLYLFCEKTLKKLKPDDVKPDPEPDQAPESVIKFKIGDKLLSSKN